MSNSVNSNIKNRDDPLAQAEAALALQDRADHVAGRLALVANAKRLLILCELTKGERSVGALQQAVGLGQSALSQHLARLREAGMVDTRREGQTIFYRISDPTLEVLMAALYDAFCRDL
ncbi:transcriptional regulator [Paracoccus sediminis]|uniref:Transcriptional regulator n=1 Tax=Paracoccus sediminis TaxID=1214787 RepID=A0A238UVT4_9RHOB|nr:metalloregulator ArsR/SmtB family transcription factor [Paracoccus sediminis]TBN52756.1 transcriptional regulator [Paracoccus sediminis]SNR26116.1 transcriptional regulator, ArsR family [Paracoccus sediminis]